MLQCQILGWVGSLDRVDGAEQALNGQRCETSWSGSERLPDQTRVGVQNDAVSMVFSRVTGGAEPGRIAGSGRAVDWAPNCFYFLFVFNQINSF